MDYVQVTFIGGPWDMTRRALSAQQVSRGHLVTLDVPEHPEVIEHAQRAGGVNLHLKTVTYELRVVGYDERGREIFVAVARP